MSCAIAGTLLYCLAGHKEHAIRQPPETFKRLTPQERPEDVPTGELPRNILMAVDRSMVGTIAPGTRITAVAIYSTVQVRGPLPEMHYC